ncbi:S-phase kinase-associated protein 1-like [Contarinia nasturtii]|uniref:S-phase kinase-associated protein 1-like n=1 Tax=Contarinia nasturtii TaxID=265458 RepID=UPI0012D3839E|nr:S-phase kinase-associated protein 1-like [Contarinia nasturtii]
MSNKFNLKSSDDKILEISPQALKHLQTLCCMIELTNLPITDAIPVKRVHSTILEIIVKWAEHHKDDSIPEKEMYDYYPNRNVPISAWDQELFTVDQATLFELIVAGEFLNVKRFLETAYKTVANMIKGKSPDEIRQTFNINKDLTPNDIEECLKVESMCDPKLCN